MSTDLQTINTLSLDLQEKVLLGGDLSKLTPAERLSYYASVCESVGLNPLTRPFEYITLNSRLTLYARKDATDQLRDLKQVSIDPKTFTREIMNGMYIVTAPASLPSGRTDVSTGVVAIDGLKGDFLANAMMKAETKAKRRVTLSICGLGMLDETELETIPEAKVVPMPTIPQIRPKQAQEAEMAQNQLTEPPQLPQDETLPAPPMPTMGSAKAKVEALAAKQMAMFQTVEGFIGTHTPRGSGKSAPPGRLTLDTITGQVLSFIYWDRPEGIGKPGNAYCRVTSKLNARQQNEITKLEWLEAPNGQ